MEKDVGWFLDEALTNMGVELPPGGRDALVAYAAELVRWNATVNLTSVTDPRGVAERHLADSLAVLPEVRGATSLLDLGSGAGLPGIPLLVALPRLTATLVDAVAKKVAFIKAGAVKAGVQGRCRAVHARAAGRPEAEGLPRAEVVISRALMDVAQFAGLASAYLAPGGRVVAMYGQPRTADELAAAAPPGLTLAGHRHFALPLSGDPRGVAVYRTADR